MTVISRAQWASRDGHEGHHVPSPFLPGRLRELWNEAGLSQAEPAGKIGSDARQVSRVAPSLETAVRITETFNADVDYLVTADATRRPLHAPANAIDARLSQLTDYERNTILTVINAITAKAKLRLITGQAG